MKIVLTRSAREDLMSIYAYHFDYSEDYADKFQEGLDAYIREMLSHNPQIGRVYNQDMGMRRLIYRKAYNIYYVVRDHAIYIVFVFDGQRDANTQIEHGPFDLPDLSR